MSWREDARRLAQAQGRPWPPRYPDADPLAPPPPRPPPARSPSVPRPAAGQPVPCQCREATICVCSPCPRSADQEDLLCPRCRKAVQLGRDDGGPAALHCHRT